MRNSLLILLVAFLSTASLSAQYFGARIGINSTNAKFKGDGADISFDAQTNLMLGAFVDLPIGGGALMLSPEINYVGRGFNLDFGGSEIKTNLAYLDLGALLKYQFVDNGSLGVYAGAGPIIGYALSGEVDDEKIEFDDDDGFNRLGLNLGVVAGATFGEMFFAELRFVQGLNSFGDDDGDTTSKWSSIGLNGGIRIPLGN